MNESISLKSLLTRFWKKAVVTWFLVILEGVCLLLMPLVIGWAVDDFVKGELLGTLQLAALCVILLMVGSGRRFYDTRVYSGIYSKVSKELVQREQHCDASVSKISARANLFTEFIEFLENSLPDVFNQLVGFVGTLGIIALIDIQVFGTCLSGAIITGLIYMLSQRKMMDYNRGQNDEFERQVDVIASNSSEHIKAHFRNLVKWNIKLSDLETLNFSLTWMVLAGVLVYSIAVVAASETATFGQVLSLVMYVFGFIESVMTFPLYYQQVIRLQEITWRLAHPQRS